MKPYEAATVALAIVTLNDSPASGGSLHALMILDGLLGLPGSPLRRAAFEEAHRMRAKAREAGPLRTLADYGRLPDVVTAVDRGERRLTLYLKRDVPAEAFAALAEHIDSRREVNTIVHLERDRRSTERRQA